MVSIDPYLKQLQQWKIGLGVILFITILRLLGLSGSLEFLAFDRFLDFLQSLQEESASKRITLVSLDQDFLDSLAEEPDNSLRQGKIPEASLKELLQELLRHNPAVIGLDIVSERISPTDEQQLAQIISQNPEIVTVEKVLSPPVSPLKNLSTHSKNEQVAANDLPVDWDGTVRRAFLILEKEKGFRESLSLRLSNIYLKDKRNIESDNGLIDLETIRFHIKDNDSRKKSEDIPTIIEVPRLRANSGAYIREDDIYGLQTLLNFRRSSKEIPVFPVISASTVLQSGIESELVHDRILIIGITAPSLASYSLTPLEISQFSNVSSQAVGIELQAHATSQIISAVLDRRPLLSSVSTPVEYLWIISVGLFGIGVGRLSTSTARNLLSLGVMLLLLLIIGLVTMYFWGWWLPIAPCFLVLSINGVAYIAYYQNERSWKRLIDERDRVISERDLALMDRDRAMNELTSERSATIETAINEIHNGPLQTLALLIRRSQSPHIEAAEFQGGLQTLDHEIRRLGEDLSQAAMASKISLRLGNGQQLDASLPLHELLYSVFDSTLNRDFPGLKTLRLTLRDFEPYPGDLTPELKRDIGHFIEEAICNVGKHAIDATQLEALGQVSEQSYCLIVRDNSAPAANHPLILHKGKGTQQAENLAHQLKGNFNRKPHRPSGVVCELSWPLNHP